MNISNLQTLPTWALVALGALIVLQVVLDVVAFLDLYRRPVEQVALGNKWIWVAIILLVNTLGAIIYLVAGRKSAPVADVRQSAPASARAATAADALYGAPKGADRK